LIVQGGLALALQAWIFKSVNVLLGRILNILKLTLIIFNYNQLMTHLASSIHSPLPLLYIQQMYGWIYVIHIIDKISLSM
jgi:hypothetical protein